MNNKNNFTGLEIAVVGMSGKFPGADNVNQYWHNLKNGIESISFLTDQEIEDLNISRELLNNPQFVRCKGGVINNKEYFDATFFKYLPKEAEILSPQTRLFHECVWEAIEDAGYNIDSNNGVFGLYAGSTSLLLWEALVQFSGTESDTGKLMDSVLSSREFLCSQTSYKLNLTGPSASVQTACSTSLVAINNACRALLTGECQVAIAGGAYVSLMTPGYMYAEGMISSKDGHVRTFDKDATGAVIGEGVGVVVLKLLKKAMKDGDNIHAIIKGTYTNNDGDEKVGFTAPGVNGQAKVIASSMRMADVPPESITYVEAHGTATTLGDVTEMEALRLAFATGKKQYCGIGSVKTNIGHLGEAAGVAGFIKTVLALKHKQIPPSLHFKAPNPKIDFQNSPFYVNAQLKEWTNTEYPLRAGVSSFGIGGTNAHVILEEAPVRPAALQGREYTLLLLSAKTQTALDTMTTNLAEHLKNDPQVNLADVAYTLQTGRKEFAFRRKMLCETTAQAIEILSDLNSRKIQTHKLKNGQHPVVFMFAGLGAQYADMCKDLYEKEPAFQQELDACFEVIEKITGITLKSVLYPADNISNEPTAVHEIDTAQYLVFVTDYCLAKLMMSWGITPHAMIGYSFGEYVAACIAGVFNLEDAIKIIHKRGQLIKSLPEGKMLSVPLTRKETEVLLTQDLSLAIDNGSSCVVSGSPQAILAFEALIKEKKLMSVRLESTRAVHSHMMDAIVKELEDFIATLTLNTPTIPYVSNVTGDWIKVADATAPAYWAKQLRNTAEFYKGIQTLQQDQALVYLELGPGSDISTLVNRELELKGNTERAINLVRPQQNNIADTKYLINKLGQLWLYGVQPDWKSIYKNEKRCRVSLPTYPFERQRYWKLIDDYKAGKYNLGAQKPRSMADWLYVPTWKRSTLAVKNKNIKQLPPTVLMFMDEHNIGQAMLENIDRDASKIISVSMGIEYKATGGLQYQIDPAEHHHYELLFADLKKNNCIPDQVIHLFSFSGKGAVAALTGQAAKQALCLGYYSLLNIAQALASLNITHNIQLSVISNGIAEVTGAEHTNPAKATLLGPVKVIPQEFSNLKCRYIDVESTWDLKTEPLVIHQLLGELTNAAASDISAIRGEYVWLPDFESTPFTNHGTTTSLSRLKEKGVYFITGGLGGTAMALANALAEKVNARLILIGRSSFPAKSEWAAWLTEHDATDSTSEKIMQLQQVEEKGGEVLIISADISDKAQLQKAINVATEKFGEINGLIHTATMPDGGMIAVREKKLSEAVFQSKLYGTLLMDELMSGHTLDFTVYFSSLNAITGGLGQVGYCAANIFLDAFAHYTSKRDNRQVVSINWDRWKNTGIARIGEKMHRELAGEELKGGMEIKEAIACFMHILDNEGGSQVAVSETGLALEIAQSRMIRHIEEAQISESGSNAGTGIKFTRPDLLSDYEAPGNVLEEKLVHMWEQFFGIEALGVHDNFFELGGDSLKGMVLLKRMKKELNFDTGIKIFFVKPTIRQISEEITEIRSLLQKQERSSKITI